MNQNVDGDGWRRGSVAIGREAMVRLPEGGMKRLGVITEINGYMAVTDRGKRFSRSPRYRRNNIWTREAKS